MPSIHHDSHLTLTQSKDLELHFTPHDPPLMGAVFPRAFIYHIGVPRSPPHPEHRTHPRPPESHGPGTATAPKAVPLESRVMGTKALGRGGKARIHRPLAGAVGASQPPNAVMITDRPCPNLYTCSTPTNWKKTSN